MVSNGLRALKCHNAELKNIKISPVAAHPDLVWSEPKLIGTYLNIESDKWPYVDRADDLSRRNSCGWETRDPSRRLEAPMFSTIKKWYDYENIGVILLFVERLRLAISSNLYGIVAQILTRFWGDTVHNSYFPSKK